MAAPVIKDEELELRIDSLAYGGNGVARLNGFVVFVKRGLPGDLGARARDEGEAQPRRGRGGRGPRARRAAGRRAVHPLPGLRRLPLPGSRVRGAARGEGGPGLRRARAGSAGSRDLELEPAVPAESIFHYRNKLEYSFTDTPVGAGLGLHRAGRWDEVLDLERCWLTTDLGNAIREAARAWARAEGLAAVRPGGAARLPAPPRRPRGAQHRAGARHARDRAGRARGRGPVRRRRCARFPEVRSIHWAVNDRPAEVTNLPDEAPLGRAVDRGGDPRQALPRAAERVPPDEHRDVRAALRPGRASTPG